MFVVIIPTVIVIAILVCIALIPTIEHPKSWMEYVSVGVISIGLIGLVFTVIVRLFS